MLKLTFVFQGLSEGNVWVELGDEVLVRVTAAMAYGDKRPASLSLPPIDGYTETLVAKAVAQVCGAVALNASWTHNILYAQIILAIQEFGQGVLRSSDGNLTLLSLVMKWESDTKALLVKYRDSNPKGWIRFCTRVHGYAKSSATTLAPEAITINEVDLSGKSIRFAEAA